MNYLQNLVEGKARTIISSIKLANENYNICLNLLKERYEDKQLMIYSYISKLLKLENITDVKDVSRLRKLFDTIDIQVRSLKNVGYEPERYGHLLIPIITSKIPDDLNLIISKRFDSADTWDKEIILNALKTEITAREKTTLVSKQGENARDEYFREPITGSTLLSHQEKSPVSCLFCKKPHKSQNCCIVSDIRTRKNIMRTSKRCFVCLKGSHLAKDCSPKIKCDLEESGHSSNTSSVTNIAGMDDNTNNLLQITKVKVKNCENSYINSARVLFDGCSQLLYITPQLHNCLKFKTVSTQKISIQTFGNECSEIYVRNLSLAL